MKKLLIVMVSACALLLGAASVSAADMKIGVVDLQQILQTSPQIAAMSQQIKSKFSPRQQAIEAVQTKLRMTAEKLGPDSKLAVADRKKLEGQVAGQQKQLQEMVVKFQEDVSMAQRQGIESFMRQITSTSSQIAKEQKLDLVLLKPALIYSGSTIDITQQVAKALPKNI